MSAFFFLIAFIVVALLVYMGRYSGRLRVDEKALVAAPIEHVEAFVRDFNTWSGWHPWLAQDPGAQTGIIGESTTVGSHFDWHSEKAGTGSVTHKRFSSGGRIMQKLAVKDPFSYRGAIEWCFTPEGANTLVRLRMRGRVSFTMRAFARTVQEMASFDARFALDRLSHSVSGTPMPYRIEYLGSRRVDAIDFAACLHEGPIETLAHDLSERFKQFEGELAHLKLDLGTPMATYLRTNVKRRTTRCAYGFPLTGEWPEGVERRHLPPHQAYVVRYVGPCERKEMAWYHAMQRLRVEGLHPHPRIPPYERFIGDGAYELSLVIAET